MYKLVFSPEFVVDIEEAFMYISSVLDSKNAAKELMKKIDSSVTMLKDTPYIFPRCNDPLSMLNYRKIVIKNYVIIYTVNECKKEVYLLRCFYGRRDYASLF